FLSLFFIYYHTSSSEIYTLSLHDALPIYPLLVSSKISRFGPRCFTYPCTSKSSRADSYSAKDLASLSPKIESPALIDLPLSDCCTKTVPPLVLAAASIIFTASLLKISGLTEDPIDFICEVSLSLSALNVASSLDKRIFTSSSSIAAISSSRFARSINSCSFCPNNSERACSSFVC